MKVLVWLVLMTVCTTVTAAAEDVEELSLPDFIKKVIAVNPGFEKIVLDGLKIKYQKTLALTADDIRLSIAPAYELNIATSNTQTLGGAVQLSKLFRETGTSVSGGYQFQAASQSDWSPTSYFNISVAQPLIQNMLGVEYKLEEKLADIAVTQSEILVAESYEEYLASMASLYNDWVSADSRLKSAQISLQSKKDLLDDILRRRKNRIALDVEVYQAQRQYLATSAVLVGAQTSYDGVLFQVRKAIGANETALLKPVTGSIVRVNLGDFDTEWAAFQTNSRTFALYHLLESKVSNQALQAYRKILPNASLQLDYNLSGAGIVPAESVSQNFKLGFNLSLPLGTTKEKAQWETAKLSEDSQKIQTVTEGLKTEQNLYGIYIQLKSAQERYDQGVSRLEYARKILAEQKVRFLRGQITLTEYLSALDTADSDEVSLLNSKVELGGLAISWMKATDRLVTHGKGNVFQTDPAYTGIR